MVVALGSIYFEAHGHAITSWSHRAKRIVGHRVSHARPLDLPPNCAPHKELRSSIAILRKLGSAASLEPGFFLVSSVVTTFHLKLGVRDPDLVPEFQSALEKLLTSE